MVASLPSGTLGEMALGVRRRPGCFRLASCTDQTRCDGVDPDSVRSQPMSSAFRQADDRRRSAGLVSDAAEFGRRMPPGTPLTIFLYLLVLNGAWPPLLIRKALSTFQREHAVE